MDIIITSKDGHPSNFISNFISSVNIADGFEVGVKSIHHGPLFNITEGNNAFTIARYAEQTRIYRSHTELTIDPGFYETAEEILIAIYKTINNNAILQSSITSTYDDQNILKLTLENRYKFCYGLSINSDLFQLLGVQTLKKFKAVDSLQYEDNLIKTSVTQPGMLYSNIVTNMTIDQQSSRLIAMIPLSSTAGYNFIEFVNPMYRPLSVSSFIDINFILTDLEGNLLEFDRNYPTVIHLHIRKNH